jgi:drug/metabolite transporter (DMT)-like permease
MASRQPTHIGALCGVGAAVLFGLGAPISKLMVRELGPLLMAGLLYLGAGLGLTVVAALRGRSDESALTRRDLPLVAGVVVSGGIAGPVLLLYGLERVSGVLGALLLNLEGVFTIALAVVGFGEHLGRRAAVAAALIFAAAALISLPIGGAATPSSGVGALLVMGACLAWGLDNNLTQRLSIRDPVAIVQRKALLAGSCNVALAVGLGAHLPRPAFIVAALGLGLVSYGLSIVLDVYALRLLGAAREAAFFATAPFVGALAALPILGERLRGIDIAGGSVMVFGVWLLIREHHGHLHTHEAIEHEHLHDHDEHHQHPHPAGMRPAGPHSHPHRHEALVHDHPHLPDLHHRHKH